MKDINVTQALQAIPEDKLPEKLRRTWTGVMLVGLGVVLSLTSVALMIRMVWVSAPISMWPVIFALAPMGVGVPLCVLGAHHWSGELMTAALKDFGNLLKIWRKNGGAK